MKLSVLVRYPTGFKEIKRSTYYNQEHEQVTMRRKTKNNPEWILTIPPGAVVPHKRFFGTKNYIVTMPEADEAIILKHDLKEEDIPVFDKKTSTKFLNKKMLDRRGEEPKETKSGMTLWILAILLIINIILQLVGQRIIRIG